MTNEAQTGSPDTNVAQQDLAGHEVGELLRSVERRADMGIDERQEQIKVLQREQRDLRAVKALASTLVTELAASRLGSALLAIERAKDARKYLQVEQPAVDDEIEALRTTLLPKVDEIVGDLARTLPAALEARGVALDPSSRSPKFTVEQAFVTATVDRKARQATVQTRGGKRERVPVDADVLADHIAAAWRRCFDRTTDLARFAMLLRDVCTELARPGESRVAMSALLEELAARDKQFAVDEFAVDLARLVTSGEGAVPEASGLHLDHTKNDAEGLLLPGLEQRGYFGYISFD